MMKKIQLSSFAILISLLTFKGYSQTKDETLDFINTKQEVFKFKYDDGTIFQYLIGTKDTNNIRYIFVVDVSVLMGTMVRKDYYLIDIKSINAVEYSVDGIGRKQILIFSKSPNIFKYNLLDNEETLERKVTLTFSKNVEIEQIKKLVNSYKHLIKLLGGTGIIEDQF